MKELKNLKKTIEELNAPTVYEDEELGSWTDESLFDFQIRETEDGYQIYDANEQYNIDYLEEVNCSAEQCAWEFGFEFEPITEDDIYEKLMKAIKKDLGEDYYLEWDDGVVMNITH